MNNKSKYLLPAGFRDLLPTEAEAEFYAIQKFMQNFAAWGYRLVSTPMVEFEDSLFYGSGKALESKTLKLFDPASQRLMGLRSDITTQISRLYESRMNSAELPARLCYFGDILRSTSANTRGDRQLKQVGVEYIGKTPDPAADAEVAIVAAESLLLVGIKNITIDLNTPNFLQNLGIKVSEDDKRKLEKREVAGLPKELAELITASGAAKEGFKKIQKNKQTEYVAEILSYIEKAKLGINITVDFVENKGFEYHDLFSFSLFAANIRDELGRGGRYNIGDFSATGVTIYINSFIDKMQPVPVTKASKKI